MSLIPSLNYLLKVFFVTYCFTAILGCSEIALYDKHDSSFHGQKITFNVEIVYIPIAELTENSPKEMRKYKFLIFEKSFALKDHTIMRTQYKTVNSGANFTIVKSYINKILFPIGDDTRMVVLEDENGILSISNIISLKFTNLNLLKYKEYLL